jgi:predicted PurR-regulated permease PerM
VEKKRVGFENAEQFRAYILWGVIAVLLIFSYFIVRPYFVALVSAFVLAYLVKPLFVRLSGSVGKTLSALICLLLILIVVILPVAFLTVSLVRQVSVYLNAHNLEFLFERMLGWGFLQERGLSFQSLSRDVSDFVMSLVTSVLKSLPSIFINLIISLFAVYFMLVNWDSWSESIKYYLPVKDKNKLVADISKTTNSLIYGTVLVAIIELAIAVPAFYFLGVSAYLLLPVLIFFFAFLPGLGPAIVWVPTAIYYFVIGEYFTAVGVLVVGVVLSAGIDAVLRSKILGRGAKVSPLLMIIGVFGGIATFGIFGFIVGPLILIYTLELLQEGIKQR